MEREGMRLMADIYHPRHQPQLGRGTPVPGGTRGSRDCGPRTVQMGIDQLTRGELVPSIQEIRRRMHKPGAQTTNTSDADLCVESYGSEMARLDRRGLDYERYRGTVFLPKLTDAVRAGDYIQVAMNYGAFNRAMRHRTGDPDFTGGHSVGVHGWKRSGSGQLWLLFDPLNDGRRKGIPNGPTWVPKEAVIAGWRSFGGYFGIFRGGERTL